jgi:hypothetical protein
VSQKHKHDDRIQASANVATSIVQIQPVARSRSRPTI